MSSTANPVYDLAVSFAGEHRDYVERVVRASEALGLRVFYDRDKGNDWWGKSFIREQRNIYGSQTRYFVPFISPEYLAKSIPMDEFSSAMMTAVERGDDYILPVIIGDVRIPPDLLPRHIHGIGSRRSSPNSRVPSDHSFIGLNLPAHAQRNTAVSLRGKPGPGWEGSVGDRCRMTAPP